VFNRAGILLSEGRDADGDQYAHTDWKSGCHARDVVLGKREGVIFIPAHLAQEVVETSEISEAP